MRFLLLAASLALATPAFAGSDYLQTDTKAYPVTPGHKVYIEFPVGHLQVEASDGDKVRLTIGVKCRDGDLDDCTTWAKRLRLVTEDDGRILYIKLDKYPKWHSGRNTVQAVLQVPRNLAMTVEMGVGDLEIVGMGGELELELGVGDADVRVPRASVSDVQVEVGVGDAAIQGAGSKSGSRGWIGRTVRYSAGPGTSRVHLEVGVGEGTVRLD